MKTFTIYLLLFILVSSMVYAGGPPPPPGNPPCWPPNACVPIDNGILILLFSGLMFGVKKIYDFTIRKNRE
ncbi:MAG: hypothetical protein HYY40_09815 [Bacteroidetes bacterium]|nr:hypothetical protein [Bacteroidota bacterium]